MLMIGLQLMIDKAKLIYFMILVGLLATSCTQTSTAPPDILVLEGASIQIDEEDRLVYTIDHAVSEVVSAYEIEMINAGWTQSSTRTVLENDRTIFINKYNHDNKEVEIAIAEQEDKTFVSILILSD